MITDENGEEKGKLLNFEIDKEKIAMVLSYFKSTNMDPTAISQELKETKDRINIIQ